MVVAVVVISCEVEIIEMILGMRLVKWRYEDKYCLTGDMKASEQQSKLGKTIHSSLQQNTLLQLILDVSQEENTNLLNPWNCLIIAPHK